VPKRAGITNFKTIKHHFSSF